MNTQEHNINAHEHTFPPGNPGRPQSPRCHQPVLQCLRLSLSFGHLPIPSRWSESPQPRQRKSSKLGPLPLPPRRTPLISLPIRASAYQSVPWIQRMSSLPAAWKAVSVAPSPQCWPGTVWVPSGLSVCRWEACCQREAGPCPPSHRRVPSPDS